IKDGHSILCGEGAIYVVSTGNDKVLRMNLFQDIKKIQYDGEFYATPESYQGMDINHINSICLADDRICISALGKKKADSWASARNGYIFDIQNEKVLFEGLSHPHSLNYHLGDLWFLESLTGNIRRNQDIIMELPDGYLRGLALTDKYMFLGVS